ncbi:transcriptional attenuator, LytR family [Austwickia chelonae]|nr:transcriptional attenuator, LytR family [Austwickia chelonae]
MSRYNSRDPYRDRQDDDGSTGSRRAIREVRGGGGARANAYRSRRVTESPSDYADDYDDRPRPRPVAPRRPPASARPHPKGAPARQTLSDPDRLPPRLRRRRAYALIGMTFVAPGSAQLIAGNRRLGQFGMRLWFTFLALVVTGAILAVVKRSWVLSFATRSWALITLAVILGVLGFLWAVTFIDAARLASTRRLKASTRRGVVFLAVIGMVVTAGPLGWAASTLYTGSTVLDSVFDGGQSKGRSKGRYNILLLGGDSGTGRIGNRPDTIMLASIDGNTGKTVTFGFARDTENINFRPGSTMARLMPKGWNCGDECLLNGLYMWATERKDRFPKDVKDPGALAMKEAVESLSGLDIQYYALIDLQGFQTMVDAIGGLEVDVKKRTPVGGGTSKIHEWIEPGRQHFNGFYALWYARSREGSTNYERMARQKCVLQAATKQVDPQKVLMKFRELAAAGKQVLNTDIPQAELGELADLALRSRSHPMKSINFTPPLIKPWSYDPQVIRSTVAESLGTATPSPTSTSTSASSSPTTSTKGSSAQKPGAGGRTSSTSKKSTASAKTSSPAPTPTDGSEICTVP